MLTQKKADQVLREKAELEEKLRALEEVVQKAKLGHQQAGNAAIVELRDEVKIENSTIEVI